jgi:hypothetical protein
MEKIKVKDEINLFRDVDTNAIINTDMQAYNNYINAKKLKDTESKRIENLENELTDVRSDLSEIKTLLRNLVNESK